MCKAEKGTVSLEMSYTDVRPEAAWRATLWEEAPYIERSPLLDLAGFHLRMVQVDLLHVFYLGVGRDLLGSALKVLIQKRALFQGRTIELRLKRASCSLRQYAKDNKLPLRCKHLTKNRLSWYEFLALC